LANGLSFIAKFGSIHDEARSSCSDNRALCQTRRRERSWKLVWSDEFEGATLDYTKWGVERERARRRNGEQQFLPSVLKMCAWKRESRDRGAEGKVYRRGQTRDFTSARIRTKHRADWKYCRVEVRAKLPQGRGLWPAIWMLPVAEKYGGWAASGELDIVELAGHEPATVHGTLHYGGTWPKNTQTGQPFTLKNGTFADDFRTFATEWEEGRDPMVRGRRALPDADEMEYAGGTISRSVRSAVFSRYESFRRRPVARSAGCEDDFPATDARGLRAVYQR
jgi:hypothetical protein